MEGEIFQIIREMTEMTGKNCQITKHGGWNIFMKSINLEGGFYFVEGEIFQIREMTGQNCQITGGWNIFMKSINVERGIFVEGGIFQNR